MAFEEKERRKRYWISFDLGLRGNYDRLFEWLDSMQAKECGDSTATFMSGKSRTTLIRELAKILNKEARIYLIDMLSGGKFVLGKRKVAPWSGFAEPSVESGEEI